jgi:hypothetical protein
MVSTLTQSLRRDEAVLQLPPFIRERQLQAGS